jgi:uncharacterized protein
MTPDLVKLRQMAEARADENFGFRDFLKHRTRLPPEEMDSLVRGLTDKVWQKTDCTACANCCREVAPTLSQEDVERLAGHLGMSGPELVSTYLKPTESGEDTPWIMGERPCSFLKDNRCTVYEYRPANCRDYPYLHKPDFTQRTLSVIGRLSECPIVFEVWEELKRETRFRYRRR